MRDVEFWLSCFIQIYIYTQFYKQIKKEHTYRLRVILVYLIYIVIAAVFYFDDRRFIDMIAVNVFIFLIGLFAYDCKRADRIYAAFTGTGILLVSCILVCSVGMREYRIENHMLMLDTFEITVFFVVKKIGDMVSTSSKKIVYFLLMIYFLGVSNILLTLYEKSRYNSSIIVSFVFLHILAAVAVDAVVKLRTQLQMQNALNKQIDYYKNELDYLEMHNSEIRRIRHDLKNHMSVLKQLVVEGENDRAAEYIERLNQVVNFSAVHVTTGNKEIDAIINNKINMMKNKNINVNYKVTFPEGLNTDPVDCIVIIGNILDNAITAVTEFKTRSNCEPEEDINFIFGYSRGRLEFSVKNVCVDDGQKYYYNSLDDKKLPDFLKTTKKDVNNHGIGVGNILSVVNKYNGYIIVEKQGGEFKMDIKMCISLH